MKWLVLLFVLFLENIYFSKKLAVLTAYKSTFLLKFLQLQCILEFYLVKTGLIHFETSFLHVAVANECTFCKKLFFTAGIGVVKWSTIEKICYRKKAIFFFDGHQMFLQNEFIQFRTYIPVKQEVHTKLCTLMWLHIHGYRLLVWF